MPNTRATIIVKKNDQVDANAWVKANVDKQGGEYTFTSPLSTNGVVTSHYWCSGVWSDVALSRLEDEYGVDLDKGKDPQAFRVAKGLQKHEGQT